MVNVGSLEIGGSINTTDIDSGLKRVDKGLGEVARTGKSVNSDFERMNNATASLAKKMGLLALAGGGALIALGKGAPALAGALAKIKVATASLGRTIGRTLQPAFDWFAGKLTEFANWSEANPEMFTGLITAIGGLALSAAIITGITKLSAFITLLSASTIAPGVLTALALIAYGGVKMEAAKEFMGQMQEAEAQGLTTPEALTPEVIGTLAVATGPGMAAGAATAGAEDALLTRIFGGFFDKLAAIARKNERRWANSQLEDTA